MSNNKEDEILRGFLSGNDAVINLFYKEHFPKIRSYILKNSGTEDDAKDVFQDALILTYKKLQTDSLRLNCSLATYVFAVSRNMWMNTLRKHKKMLSWDKIPNNIPENLNSSILEDMQNGEKLLLYQKHFRNLGTSCRKLLGHFFLGKSMDEISQLMDYSVGYTRKKKFECKKRLLEMLEVDPVYKEFVNGSPKNNEE
ncbi:MAG: sigma-70 family RNA polymerase sigma factor [Bacteroidota bacterium]